ncbi:MAG: hypothetical protein K0R03_1348 [Moraxellaceae bacterium]|jgi:hypothetical protein|nr:hypothetical protein [Moraxellaceae bacterium]MDF3030790.1 hypothetical protein [Moraxellaceae bacterium]
MLQMTPHELDSIREECRKLANRKATVSAGAAVLPVPLLDVAADIRLLSRLLPEISERFGLSPEKIREMPTEQREKVHWHMRNRQPGFFGQLMMRTLVRRNLQKYLGRLLTTQVAKFVPFAGTLVAGTLGYLTLKQIANRYIDECYEVAKAIWPAAAPPQPA